MKAKDRRGGDRKGSGNREQVMDGVSNKFLLMKCQNDSVQASNSHGLLAPLVKIGIGYQSG